MDTLEDKIDKINEKLDFLIEESKWLKKKWDDSGSFSQFMKNWSGFYIASLLADETLGLNGGSSILGNNKNS